MSQKGRANLFNDHAHALHCKACQSLQGAELKALGKRYRTDTGPDYTPKKSRKKKD